MKRSGWLKRCRLKPRAGWLKRKARLKVKGGSRFPKRRNPEYRAFIRTFPCVVEGCEGQVECCHVRTRGAGGEDEGGTFPCCRKHHSLQHSMGVRSFQERFGLDLWAIAGAYAEGWVQGEGRADSSF